MPKPGSGPKGVAAHRSSVLVMVGLCSEWCWARGWSASLTLAFSPHAETGLDNAAEAARKRPLKRGQRFEGLAVEAVRSAQQVARHFAERGSDSDPLLVWVLNVAVTEMDAAAAVLGATVWRPAPTLPPSNAPPAPAPRPSAKSWMSTKPASTSP